MGGMQALEWAVAYPEASPARSRSPRTARHSAQQIAFNEVGRQAIMADPDWSEGNYYGKKPPARGLAVARMVGHITYMSDDSMREKFGRRLPRAGSSLPDFSVGTSKSRATCAIAAASSSTASTPTRTSTSPRRWTISTSRTGTGPWPRRLNATQSRFLVISFTSDWLYPTTSRRRSCSALRGRNRDVAFCELQSNYGHDAFLVDVAEQTELMRGFLASTFGEGGRAS